MSSLQLWVRVPDRSELRVKVTPSSANVVTAAAVTIDGLGPAQALEWSQTDLVPGPKTLALQRPGRYTVRVWCQFKGNTAATAVIEAEIAKSDGTTYGSPYSYTVSGAKDQVARATIIALTLL